ncbi:MAG: pyrroline-5-carboxylate reductase [Candidatus Melainabacteria bacterium]|nr:pyrroline-5-carboxylate reductase [Candidatus Melainabacteria bacterium]
MKKLIIIGGGRMGYAIACGITQNKLYKKHEINFVENSEDRISFLRKKGFTVYKDFYSKNISAILLAVKPREIKEVLTSLKRVKLKKSIPIISIAAGIKIKTISSNLSLKQPIARVMPNTPCQIGEGMSVITFNKHIFKKDKNKIKNIFKSIGRVVELKEENFDLITALSGSGPAYYCYFIECMTKSIMKLRTSKAITKKTVNQLVLQTALGTIKLLTEGNIPPEKLRESVTSPHGTTEAALNVFKKRNLYNIISSAIKAARNKSIQLSKIFLIVIALLGFYNYSLAQDPIKLSTKTEDIALTDDINIARAQVVKYPDNPEAHFNLAVALSKTSLVEEAIKELYKTKKLIRKDENKRIIDKKINEYLTILKESPEANNVKYRLAFSHYLKAYLIAKEYEKKEKENKNFFESQSFLSINKKYKKFPEIKENVNLSLNYFKELIEENPHDSWSKIYYAFIIAEQTGDTSKAKELWKEVVNKDPNNPAPHFFLGELHIKEGNLKEGVLEISQALLLRTAGY